MPWFLNPAEYTQLPLYLNPELYYFLAKLLATGFFARTLWRRGVRGRSLFAGTCVFFSGLFVAVMLSLHGVVITGLRLLERPEGTPFVFDFHLYSLLLLPAVLVPQGVRLLRAAGAMAADAGARREALRATLVVLALAVPLIPLQFFGMVLTVLGMTNLGALALARDGATHRPRAAVAGRPERALAGAR